MTDPRLCGGAYDTAGEPLCHACAANRTPTAVSAGHAPGTQGHACGVRAAAQAGMKRGHRYIGIAAQWRNKAPGQPAFLTRLRTAEAEWRLWTRLGPTGGPTHRRQTVLSAACWPDVPVARRRTRCGTLRTNGAENAAAGPQDRSEPKACEKCGHRVAGLGQT